ncbi:hypothetical protein ACVWXM_002564 [Bradyrhizobium sp. GM7.3]
MSSLKIHAAESNVAVWEKNITILPFVRTCQCSNDWLPRSNHLLAVASPAARRTRTNQRFVRNYADKVGMHLAHDYEEQR